MVDPVVSPRIKVEMAEHPQPKSTLDRIQIIEISEINDADMVDDLKSSGKETMPIYLKALFTGVGLGGISPAFGPPTLAIFDVRRDPWIRRGKSAEPDLVDSGFKEVS